MSDLSLSPYFLSSEQINSIQEKLKTMSIEEKIGQLFFVIGPDDEQVDLEYFISKYQPGGVMYRPSTAEKIKSQIAVLQKVSKIPLFTAANLEAGGNGILTEGTYFSQPLGVAATGDSNNAYQLGKIGGAEGKSVGINMAFGPIVDIDLNFQNPITNTRTFGSSPETVITFAKQQMEGFKAEGVIPVIKHFPGDGVDQRDQHLLSSVNILSTDHWDQSFGKVYKSFIEEDIPAIMIGHILLPEYVQLLNPENDKSQLLPASLSSELIQGLLRRKLGFNGLTITDATPMIGYNASLPREIAIPSSIAAGIDMILFNKNIDEDYLFMKNGLAKGLVTEEQINQAVLRILGTKAAQGIFETKVSEGSSSLAKAVKEKYSLATVKNAKEAVTLVKDTKNYLPLSPKKTSRIRLYVLGDEDTGGFKQGGQVGNLFKEKLTHEGFEVTIFDPENLDFHEVFEEGVADLKEKFDLAFYVANVETASNQTTTRINWIPLMAANAPWFVQDIPTIFVSTANPYHLFDVPMVPTYINAYSSNKETIDAVIEKVMGREEFVGKTPVDPFQNTFGVRF
nr:glycoside hydrolase family 3 N-terminal domain-containing protein [Carnobacterium mobile]